jgi:uncharacterized protein (TIRG00374 family)
VKTAENTASGTGSGLGNVFSAKYLLFSVGFSVLCIAGITWLTWTPGILDSLKPKRLPGLFIALLVTVLRSVFASLRIWLLAERRISLAGAMRVSLTWDFSSGVLPSWIGGAPLATMALAREKLKLGESTAVMLFATFLDQLFFALAIPLLLFASLFWKVFPPGLGHAWTAAAIMVFVLILLYAAVLAYGVIIDPSTIRRVLNRLTDIPLFQRWKETTSEVGRELEDASRTLRSKPKSFLYGTMIHTSLMWLCRMTLPIIVLLSFMPADPWLSFLRSMAINFGGLLMPTPGGAGGLEGLYAVFLGPLMIRPGFMGITIFLWRFISYYISIGAGMAVVLWYLRRPVAGASITETPR